VTSGKYFESLNDHLEIFFESFFFVNRNQLFWIFGTFFGFWDRLVKTCF